MKYVWGRGNREGIFLVGDCMKCYNISWMYERWFYWKSIRFVVVHKYSYLLENIYIYNTYELIIIWKSRWKFLQTSNVCTSTSCLSVIELRRILYSVLFWFPTGNNLYSAIFYTDQIYMLITCTYILVQVLHFEFSIVFFSYIFVI